MNSIKFKSAVHTRTILTVCTIFVGLTVLSGCRSELYDQEYGEPLEQSNFYSDKRMSRPLVEGTVSQKYSIDQMEQFAARDEAGELQAEFPEPVTKEVMARGRERFNIYCSPCHGYTGRGDGMIVKRGMKTPPSFLDQRLVQSPPGYFVEVITNGFGVMYSYASRVQPRDRWAIAAYLRALQRAGGTIPATDSTATSGATTIDSTAAAAAGPSDSTDQN